VIAMPDLEYQSVMSRYRLYLRIQNVSTTTGQPVNCEIAGYYVMADDECHEVLSPRNITCSGEIYNSTHVAGFISGFRSRWGRHI
jgi:hypothetical protein